ncbi:hypothetical protein psyc5s11_39320 [Clostridium gelidum]|uniref:Fe-containing alcohol dehydrogenase-like C-terminal domain-containing protein n=1 Tax=Clostridium gelidum TaxID=704125 RepID=A0ABN6J0J8_9CLOT|nr:hypothetical protein psyc5s11_39320 [Clostridium gelidum]
MKPKASILDPEYTYSVPKNQTADIMSHIFGNYFSHTQGVGLAILTPHWMKYSLDDTTVNKFAQYGINVWNIDKNLENFEIANIAIEKTTQFFKELGIPSTLREVGIEEEKFEIMAKKAMNPYFKYAFKPLDENNIINIFKAAF